MIVAAAHLLGGPTGVELPFVPLIVVQVWRTLFFIAGLVLIARLAFDTFRPGMPAAMRWGGAGVIVFVARSLIVQAERWYVPVTVEGLPLLTVALACCWCGARAAGRAQAPR